MKFPGAVGDEPRKISLNYSDDPDTGRALTFALLKIRQPTVLCNLVLLPPINRLNTMGVTHNMWGNQQLGVILALSPFLSPRLMCL